MADLVDIHDATVFRGDKKVFDHFSLTLHAGSHTAILGPNGAGKTTLLKLLSQELFPVQREESWVRLFGQALWNVWELRARLGIVSNDLHQKILGTAPGLDVILSGYYSAADVWAHQTFTEAEQRRAREILRELGVEGLARRAFKTMSSGEQRRFLLGRALVHAPEALVLDEPTTGLDLKACFQYLEIVRNLMKAGTTVVVVTHHIHEIPPEIDRVVLLKAGRIVADGPKKTVLTSESLSALFETPVRLLEANGFYQAVPGGA